MNPALSEKRVMKGSIVLKMAVIGVLIVVLLVPLLMTGAMVSERQSRYEAVTREVASTWGNPQTLGGPVLVVPYRGWTRNEKGDVIPQNRSAVLLPETLDVKGSLQPEMRSRGIFDVAVYRADLHLSGTFARPDLADWGIAEGDLLWNEAYLAIGIPDMRGIRRGVQIAWAGKTLPLTPGGGVDGLWASGLRATLPDAASILDGKPRAFSFDLVLNGSRELRFLPFGKQTTVRLTSPWASPSFSGAFLPESRQVGPKGFAATWSVPWFGRGYPQQWQADQADRTATLSTVDASAFGVELFLPVDVYQKTMRSVKYGVLFIVLTFLTFFLYELFSPFALHPMQYLLVGSALCLFYVLLLSISEHAPFALSYVVASVATIALISGYAAAILRGRLRALGVAAALAALYSYLYVLLQAEDYALLLGAIGLFLTLAFVMWITRRIDWYAPRTGETAVEG
jgi:inner membrane protein